MPESQKLDGGLLVVIAGTQMTVQDLGRSGLAYLGVTRSGAADIPAHIHANALVGNDPEAATLEVTAGSCEVRALEDMLVAVTGARGPMWVGSVPAPFGSPMRLRAGQTLELGAPKHGLRSYIAVRGGIDVDPVLGSRATDVLSGLGPEPMRDGATVPIGSAIQIDQAGFDELRRLATAAPAARPAPAPAARPAPAPAASQGDMSAESDPKTTLSSPQQAGDANAAPAGDGVHTDATGTDTGELNPAGASAVFNVRVRLGPRDDWFTPAACDALLSEPFEVSPDSNRVGVRLTGPALERAHHDELESEGLMTGAVQVPTSGQPVIFLADHPVTGGYPVIAVVEPEDLPLVAQARPGDRVQFQVVTRREV